MAEQNKSLLTENIYIANSKNYQPQTYLVSFILFHHCFVAFGVTGRLLEPIIIIIIVIKTSSIVLCLINT